MTQYAILSDGVPHLISTAHLVTHVETHTGRRHSAGSLRRWAANDLRALDIWPVQQQSVPSQTFQLRSGMRLEVDDEALVVHAIPTFSDMDLKGAKQAALKQVAQHRYETEVGGTTVNGFDVATDVSSQSKLIAVRINAREDPAYTVKWKTSSGFVTLTAAQIILITDAVRQHVQDCFDWEADKAMEIEACSTLDDLRLVTLSFDVGPEDL